MPMNIYESETVKELAYLAEDDWGLFLIMNPEEAEGAFPAKP